jgi:hypothetical protein
MTTVGASIFALTTSASTALTGGFIVASGLLTQGPIFSQTLISQAAGATWTVLTPGPDSPINQFFSALQTTLLETIANLIG